MDGTTLEPIACDAESANSSGCEASRSTNMASVDEIALKVIYITIGSSGLLGNTLVIVVIFTYTSMKKKLTNIFLINQSMIDLVASVFILAQSIFEVDGTDMKAGNARDEFLCSVWLTRAPLWSMLMSSTYNLVFLTLERYFEVVHPIAHKIKFTKKKALLGMAFVWLIGPAYNLAYEVPTSKIIDGVCFPFAIWPSKLVQSSVGVLTILLQYILPIAIMTYCYVKIALKLKRRVHVSTAVSANNGYERARKNIIKTLVIVCLCFLFCWTWNEVFIFLYFVGNPTDFSSPFYHFTVVAVFVNSCINPFVYTLKYEEFQRGLRKVLCKCVRRGQVTSGNGNSGHSTNATRIVVRSISAHEVNQN